MNGLSKEEFYKLTNEERIAINRKERLGETKFNNSGESMKIIDYIDSKHILIQFDNGHSEWTDYGNFKKGRVRNLSKPSSYGVAYCNIPKGAHKYVKEHEFWRSMLRRCYSERWKKDHPSYIDTQCDNEWLYFDAFVEWIHGQENWGYIEKTTDRFHLDKDILIKGNKNYSPNACCLVPHRVNTLFIKSERNRGMYPIGVTFRRGKYESHCNVANGKVASRSFTSAEEAFYQYKADKEKYIRQIATEEFAKGTITQKCYNAMMNYQVEITD